MKSAFLILLLLSLTLISLSSSAQQSFNSNNVPLYHGNKAKVIIKGNSLARMFRTTIKDTYYSTEETDERPGGLNFAGHYCFVYWGCGSSCQSSAVVDVKTGIVYPGVDASLGYTFKPNSALLVVNPDANVDSELYKTEYWLWNDKSKKFIKIH